MFTKTKLAAAFGATALFSAGAWAVPDTENSGQPGLENPGSTLISETVAVNAIDFARCSDRESMVTPDAYARASAFLGIRPFVRGRVAVDLSRHGKNGAVHAVDLNSAITSGTIGVVVSHAEGMAEADATALARRTARAIAEPDPNSQRAVAIADARVTFEIPVVDDLTAYATAEAFADAYADADAMGFAFAQAQASASGDSEGSVDGRVNFRNVGRSTADVHIHGANIEEFEAMMTTSQLSTTRVFAQSMEYAAAYAYTRVIARVLATASTMTDVQACASIKAGLEGLINDEWLNLEACAPDPDEDPVVTRDRITRALIQGRRDVARAYAEATAAALLRTRVGLSFEVSYVNENGTDDTFEVSGVANANASCRRINTAP